MIKYIVVFLLVVLTGCATVKEKVCNAPVESREAGKIVLDAKGVNLDIGCKDAGR